MDVAATVDLVATDEAARGQRLQELPDVASVEAEDVFPEALGTILEAPLAVTISAITPARTKRAEDGEAALVGMREQDHLSQLHRSPSKPSFTA